MVGWLKNLKIETEQLQKAFAKSRSSEVCFPVSDAFEATNHGKQRV